jgi:hypothetical protein
MIVNSGIKGPGWLKVEKKFLNYSQKWVEGSLCA